MPKSRKKFIDILTEEEPKFISIIEKNEDGTIKSNPSVLGMFEGVFFVPDGDSRNGRHYTRLFWETLLNRPDIVSKINNLMMYGAIGHKDTPVSDDDLNEGKVSHIVVKLWIDDKGRGMGRCIILNTPAGRNLYTYFTVEYEGKKSQLKISSRGAGDYKEGLKINGLPVVDEEGFFLDTFDIVKEAGFPETNLALKENENKNIEGEEEDFYMPLSESEVKAIAESLKNQIGSTNEDISTIKSENVKLKADLEKISETAKILENADAKTKNVLIELSKNNQLNFVAEWHEFGTPTDMKEAHDLMESEITILEGFKALVESPEQLKEFQVLVESKLATLKEYEKLATLEEFKETLTYLTEITPKLEKIGNLDEVITALTEADKNIPSLLSKLEKANERIITLEAKALSEKYSKPIDFLIKGIKKSGLEETKRMLSNESEGEKTPQDYSNSKSKPKMKNEGVSNTEALLTKLNKKENLTGASKIWASMEKV